MPVRLVAVSYIRIDRVVYGSVQTEVVRLRFPRSIELIQNIGNIVDSYGIHPHHLQVLY